LASREEAIAVLSQARADADTVRAEARATAERARAEVAALIKRREEITAQIKQLSGDLQSIRVPDAFNRASQEMEVHK